MTRARSGEQKLPRHERQVREARREVEARMDDLRTALDREIRWLPRGKAWTLPLVGLACGVAMALGRRKGRGERVSAGRSGSPKGSGGTD